MKKQLIALDLDGTLLYDWATLKKETETYLKSLKEEGHTLVIATGRPYRSAIGFYDQLELNTPLINYNGGLITWRDNPDFNEVNITVDYDAVLDIFKNNAEYIDNAFCEVKDDIYLWRESEEIQDLLHYFNGATLQVGPFEETLPADQGTNGFIVVAKHGKGHLIEEYVRRHYPDKVLARNWGDDYQFIIELYTPLTNKGNAISHVAKELGFDHENIIAFGDGHNDIEMLQTAGTGIAMQHSHAELKAVADIISPYDNQSNAIEYHLKQMLKK